MGTNDPVRMEAKEPDKSQLQVERLSSVRVDCLQAASCLSVQTGAPCYCNGSYRLVRRDMNHVAGLTSTIISMVGSFRYM